MKFNQKAWDSAQRLLSDSGYGPERIISTYPYGSHVYGNARSDSDYDYIVIFDKGYSNQLSSDFVNINLFSQEVHLQRIAEHEVSALETLWTEPLYERRNFLKEFSLDKSKLRHSFSSKSSNSWIKAKKKLTVERDYDAKVGKKSLWHAIRIVDFGIQIANHGKIVDYGSCNHFFDDVMYSEDWNSLYEKYKQIYNTTLTEFRKIAPK